MKKTLLNTFMLSLLFMGSAVLFTSCAQNTTQENQGTTAPQSNAAPTATATVQDIDATTFIEKMKEPNTVILDVRTPEEYSAGHIPNSVLIDFTAPDFSTKIKDLDKSKTYLVYCAAGSRSKAAGRVMVKNNFQSVYNMLGGFMNYHGPSEK